MSIDVKFLSSLSYFSDLSPSELEIVRQSFIDKTIQRGEMVFLEGEFDDTMYIVVTGVVKLFKTSAQGKEQIISLARPHDVLNDISIFDNGPNPIGAQALSPVTLSGIKKDKLETILQQFPKVSSKIIESLAARTRQLISLVEDLSFKHVIGRVAKILLEHAGNGNNQSQRLTQQEMAAMAGTAREVVARSLKAMEERGVIRLERQRIIISDKNALQEIAYQEV